MAIIGIDLGTSNSLVGYWTESGPKLIPNAFGEYLTPSVVSIDEQNQILVGKIAKERLITHPDCTVAAFKRFIGSHKSYQLGKYNFSATDLSSLILKSLKEDAETFLNEEINEAVISVPAYFNDIQRQHTKLAAEMAGFKVERLISEPTAAALAYGLHEMKDNTQFLVFDLGGGTFDVSVIEYYEEIMEVKSVAGDNYLGGEDFTELLYNHFIEQTQLDTHLLSETAKSLIYKQAERCKRELGVGVTSSMRYETNEQKYELEITYGQFEKLATGLLSKLRHPVERALRDADLRTDDLDAVLLIGGATRMPLIRTTVGKMFGHFPLSTVNPDEAVALGATVQAALKKRNTQLGELILTDVCPFTLGVDVAKEYGKGQGYKSGFYSPIIERNSPIPISRVQSYSTIDDYQKVISFDIYQGENMWVANNLLLGTLSMSIPKMKKGEVVVDVRFTYDLNGILEVEVTVRNTGVTERIIIQNNENKLSQEQVEKRMAALKNLKIHPRDRAENKLILARAERLYEELKGYERTMLTEKMAWFEGVLQRQYPDEIKKAATEFTQLLDELDGVEI